MGRGSRVIYLLGLMGLALLGYIARKGLLHLTYLGLVLGFTAGFMIDASAREKNITDNLAFGTFLAGVLAYLDMYYGITDLTRVKLGEGFILAAITLALIALTSSIYDEVRVGRTVRISYLPTIAMILALILIFNAVHVDTSVSYVRTSYFDTTIVDTIHRYNSTSGYTHDISKPATPVVNGSKLLSQNAPSGTDAFSYIHLAVYTVHNTSRIWHPGNLSVVLQIVPCGTISKDNVKLVMKKNGADLHDIHPAELTIDTNSCTIEIVFRLSSADVYYANIADRVMLAIDFGFVQAQSVSISLDMKIVGKRVLDKTTAYITLLLEAIAAILAVPEDLSKRVSRRRRKARVRR